MPTYPIHAEPQFPTFYSDSIWKEFPMFRKLINQTLGPVNLSLYLNPKKTPQTIISLMVKALAEQKLRRIDCPFMYLLAVYHVSHFVYDSHVPMNRRVEIWMKLLYFGKHNLLSWISFY